jgi:hypothetical protein
MFETRRFYLVSYQMSMAILNFLPPLTKRYNIMLLGSSSRDPPRVRYCTIAKLGGFQKRPEK